MSDKYNASIQPSKWTITSNDGSVVTAFNSYTNEHFSGPLTALNSKFTRKPQKENAAIYTDSNGEILATVLPRTGKLADLMSMVVESCVALLM